MSSGGIVHRQLEEKALQMHQEILEAINEALLQDNEEFALELYRSTEMDLSQSQRNKAFGLIRAYRQRFCARNPASSLG